MRGKREPKDHWPERSTCEADPLFYSRRTRVVNMKSSKDWTMRIDRRSKWGNPFRIGEDGDRREVIQKYMAYLELHPEIADAARKELSGHTLGCWCKPLECHGDILAAICDEQRGLTGPRGEGTD